MSSDFSGVLYLPWWRFNRYEHRGGYIRPAPGATLESYDLNTLNDGMTTPEERRDQFFRAVLDLDPANVEQVLDWCSRFGLLGLLPHQALFAATHPRWVERQGRDQQRHWVRFQQLYYPLGPDFHGGTIADGDLDPPEYVRPDMPIALEGAPSRSPSLWREPGTVVRRLHKSVGVEFETLKTAWGRYFPDVHDGRKAEYSYPEPYTLGFWKQYAEPLQEFQEAWILLRTAIGTIEGEKRRTKANLFTINRLLEPTWTYIELAEDRKLVQRWRSPSLLGSLVLMIIGELNSNRWPVGCPVCRKPLPTEGRNRTYCSDTCRNTANTGLSRKKKRARSFYDQGTSEDRAAWSLDLPRETVAAWYAKWASEPAGV